MELLCDSFCLLSDVKSKLYVAGSVIIVVYVFTLSWARLVVGLLLKKKKKKRKGITFAF